MKSVIEFKEAYEQFKTRVLKRFLLFNTFFLLVWTSHSRVWDVVQQSWLCAYYMSLALREAVLLVNGSRIQRWWIWHHYLSTAVCILMLTWPDSQGYLEFSWYFYAFAEYWALVQFLQTRYQRARLYRKKALGKVSHMEVADVEGTQAGCEPELLFLLPFLLFGNLFHLFNAYKCACIFVRENSWQPFITCCALCYSGMRKCSGDSSSDMESMGIMQNHKESQLAFMCNIQGTKFNVLIVPLL